MTYTPLLIVALAFVAATGFSLQDSQSYDSLLSALSAMPDKTPVEYRPGYPSTLQRELEEHLGFSSGSRVSRSALRKPEKYTSCCGSAVYTTFSEEVISIYPECHPENMHGGEIGGESFNSSVLCLTDQCHSKKIGVVDAEGYLLKDAFVNAASSWYREDSVKTLAKKLAQFCVPESNAFSKEKLVASDSEQKCNLAPYLVKFCMDDFVIAACPEDLKINGEQCEKRREYVKQLVRNWTKDPRIN